MSEEKKLPSIGRMAVNYAKAKGRQIKKKFKGEELLVEEDEYEDRLMICRMCWDHYMLDDNGEERCNHPSCGCFLEEKAKYVTEACPLSKWPGQKELEEFEDGEEEEQEE